MKVEAGLLAASIVVLSNLKPVRSFFEDFTTPRLPTLADQTHFSPRRPITDRYRHSPYAVLYSEEADEWSNARKQAEVRQAFQDAWEGYRRHAWGADEVRPVTGDRRDTRNGWGATVVDALDTLFIMGFEEEFLEARDFVAQLDWTKPRNSLVNVFETTIRYVGGLLAAYDLSEDRVFLDKAEELVSLLLPAFDSPTGMPWQNVDFDSGKSAPSGFPNGASVLAEVGTVQLEFTHLSYLTGNWTYHAIAQKTIDYFDKHVQTKPPNAYPMLIDVTNGKLYTGKFPIQRSKAQSL
ncbi:hypothetical protein BZG36_00037 [Bifiguratus adelaidae]|uniref:alpha-1,2-Mannosidase n=1 Tax=Bifiguratus adelaidae TaxID=1938954 RepID=A0A261Y8I2_9FUNG|nr:hypothetical protein BZG36_00037 [Bifiguratus adelaidae]